MSGHVDSASSAAQEFLRRPRFILGQKRRQHYRDRLFREAQDSPNGGRLPDYVGVGVQRAGTSRWHTMITAHPDAADVTDPVGREVKEIHWFDQPFAGDADARHSSYRAWFDAPEDKVIGEITPRYLYDLWPIDQLAQICPKAKILVFLREPLSRLTSALQFYGQRGIELDRDSVRESVWRGIYSAQIEYLLDCFPREQILFNIYEYSSANPEAELARLYRFLELDDSFVPEGLNNRVNGSAKIDIPEYVTTSARRLYEADRPRLEAVLPDIDFSIWS